jgi:hypothetical protein
MSCSITFLRDFELEIANLPDYESCPVNDLSPLMLFMLVRGLLLV